MQDNKNKRELLIITFKILRRLKNFLGNDNIKSKLNSKRKRLLLLNSKSICLLLSLKFQRLKYKIGCILHEILGYQRVKKHEMGGTYQENVEWTQKF